MRRVVQGEIALPTWAAFAGEELLSDQVMASVLAGVSTRSYKRALEPVGSDLAASATSRSAVSRM
ncbi:MAG: hypothetical protein ACREJP_11095 [Candidatus Methylomirabilales bacterium]